jgi:hypothetical protein
MKKVIYTLLIVVMANVANAQGFLKKIKAKVTQAVEQPVANQLPQGMASAAISNGKWADPGICGTVVKTFSKKELDDHMGSFDIWFPYVRVVNNQLQLQVADYSSVLYDYTNGKLIQAGTPPNVDRNALKNGNEFELRSIDFTQQDQMAAMMKNGPHVSSGMIAGKPMQSLTFKGKPIGSFMMFQIAHNADSSVVSVAGASINGGLKYSLVSSAGQTLALPAKPGALPLVSPDGKFSAAWVGQDNQAYVSNGTVVKTAVGVFPGKLWLRNTGSVFCLVDDHNSTLYKNGAVYHAFDMHLTPKQIFISKDDKNMCWEGDHGLYFSDGMAFENGTSPHKVLIEGKEVMVFLAINLTSGQLYLCKKEL